MRLIKTASLNAALLLLLPSLALASGSTALAAGDRARGASSAHTPASRTTPEGQSTFAIIDLGTLGGSSSTATAVNDTGQVVGASATASRPADAFSWTQAGGMIDLRTSTDPSFPDYASSASAVNKAGQVVGGAGDVYNGASAFSWTQAGGTITLARGGGGSGAVAVNDAGQVVGNSAGGTLMFHSAAFSWTPAGGIVYLGNLPGGSFSWASAVNDAGQAVGESSIDSYYSEPRHAFSWTQVGGMVDLGTIGATGCNGASSRAVAVNDAGQIVGTSDTGRGGATPFHHAVLWERGCVVPDVRSKTLAQTRLALTRATCTVGAIRRIHSRKKQGLVLAQSPNPWTCLASNSPVRLTVSKGPKPHHHGRKPR